MVLRNLTASEIEYLEKHNCRSDDWQLVMVNEKFIPDNILNTSFYGRCIIGMQSGLIEVYPGIKKTCGIYDSEIRNSEIADHVYIKRVDNLANYTVESDVAIENVNRLAVTGETSFGNGIEIEVLNEAGGRELMLVETLSSQLAYLMVMYRHDPDFIEKLKGLFQNEVSNLTSDTGRVGRNARVLNCHTIENVRIGEAASIIDALRLQNGTIASAAEAPVYIGEGVIANGFIIQSGSKVDGSAVLSKCFIGQGVQIGRQYSAENSAFFANCEGFHGEACSIFAAPYTVTHHKSTLLIAGLFSFYNAGSGTNQSNHMYKLGPVHQGILERGAKTGSFSYMLWPSRVGAFSAVIGKHYVNFDGSEFPFSYITEEDGKSVLTPAMNLFTVGTRRDSAKWPNRDRRKSKVKHDLIHFDLFNPYTISKMLIGKKILQDLYATANKEKEWVQVKGFFIKRLLLKRCAKYYDMALKIYIGNQVVKILEKKSAAGKVMDMISGSGISDSAVSGKWIDLAGMITEQSFILDVMNRVKEGKYDGVQDLKTSLHDEFGRYEEKNMQYALQLIEHVYGKSANDLGTVDLKNIISEWNESSIKLNNMILADAQKEFDSISQIGFGIDGDTETIKADFNSVRGTYTDNKFVRELMDENSAIQERSAKLFELIDTGN